MTAALIPILLALAIIVTLRAPNAAALVWNGIGLILLGHAALKTRRP